MHALIRAFSSAAAAGAPRTSRVPVYVAAFLAGGAAYGAYNYSKMASSAPKPQALNGEFVDFKLKSITKINHNTSTFHFELPTKDHQLGLPTASLLVTKADIDGKTVIRPYTPTSPTDQQETFDLVVKKYPNGPMSSHIHSLKPGDTLSMKGPITKYFYKPNMRKAIGMIAGGSGITPMIQVIQKALSNKDDHTKLSLLFGNIKEEDIILKKQLDDWAKRYPDRFEVQYILDSPPADWKGEKGYITKEMIEKYMPNSKDQDGYILLCGPPPMVSAIAGPKAKDNTQGDLSGLLAKLNYSKDNVFKY